MAIVLTVSNPFGGYRRGERITDPKAVEKVLASEHAADVVKVSQPDDPAPRFQPPAD